MKLRSPLGRVLLNGSVLALITAGIVFAALYLKEYGHQLNLSASVSAPEIILLTNQNRIAVGLLTLSTNPLLTEAAQLKANDMAAGSYYAHISPDGKSPLYWLSLVGYSFINAGENLVIDRTTSEQVVSSWMLSTDHRENILRPQFTEVGVGTAEGEYKGLKTIYVVQEFGTPSVVQKPQTQKTTTLGNKPTSNSIKNDTAELVPKTIQSKKIVETTFEIKSLVAPKIVEAATTTSSTSGSEKKFEDLISPSAKAPPPEPSVISLPSTSTQASTSIPLFTLPKTTAFPLPPSEEGSLTSSSAPQPPKEVRATSYAPQAYYRSNTVWFEKIFQTLKESFLSLY